jgi:hypothetical protein
VCVTPRGDVGTLAYHYTSTGSVIASWLIALIVILGVCCCIGLCFAGYKRRRMYHHSRAPEGPVPMAYNQPPPSGPFTMANSYPQHQQAPPQHYAAPPTYAQPPPYGQPYQQQRYY